jgi:hypothetical protein
MMLRVVVAVVAMALPFAEGGLINRASCGAYR